MHSNKFRVFIIILFSCAAVFTLLPLTSNAVGLDSATQFLPFFDDSQPPNIAYGQVCGGAELPACPVDTDGDGLEDGIDPCPTDPTNQCNAPAVPLPYDPNGDSDGDGVINRLDNCENTPNADQRDTFGDSRGDACATDFYEDNGCVGFFEKDVKFSMYGNCQGDNCAYIGGFNPITLASQLTAPDSNIIDTGDPQAGGWYLQVYELPNTGETSFLQVNVYNGGSLVCDSLQISVSSDGLVQWTER